MWELINFTTRYFDNGCDVSAEDMFQLRNNTTGETKWVDSYEFGQFKRLGLVV